MQHILWNEMLPNTGTATKKKKKTFKMSLICGNLATILATT